MKINFKSKENAKNIYKVGNVIKDVTDTLYLIVGGMEDGYAMVNLTDNRVTNKYQTLEELADTYADKYDALVYAEINVF